VGGAGGKGGWRRAGGGRGGTQGAPGARLKDPGGQPNSRSCLWLGAGKGTLESRWRTWQVRARRQISTADSAQAHRPRTAPPLGRPRAARSRARSLLGKGWGGGKLPGDLKICTLSSRQQSRARPLTSCVTLGESHHLSGPQLIRYSISPYMRVRTANARSFIKL
jgi:hypothetical protein